MFLKVKYYIYLSNIQKLAKKKRGHPVSICFYVTLRRRENEMRDDITFIRQLMLPYQLNVYDFKEKGKIRKLYTDKGIFALKELHRPSDAHFIRWLRELYFSGYPKIVPIIPTLEGNNIVYSQNRAFYLMPWLNSGKAMPRKDKVDFMFKEAARIHAMTVKNVVILEEESKSYYEKLKSAIEEDLSFCEGCVEQFENQWYMSPFELQFCTYFNEIYKASMYALRSLENWYEIVKNEKKIRMTIVHGKLSPDHLLFDERGYSYFINFEKCRQDLPIFDLYPYIKQSYQTHPLSSISIDWYKGYCKYFPLKEEEENLLKCRLARPKELVKVVQHYVQNKNRNEREYTMKLQKEYWHFKNIESFIMKIEEFRQSKSEDIST